MLSTCFYFSIKKSLVKKGENGKAVIHQLLGGHISVGDIGAEIDMDKEGGLPCLCGQNDVKGKGKFLLPESSGSGNDMVTRLARTKARYYIFLDLKAERVWTSWHFAIFFPR